MIYPDNATFVIATPPYPTPGAPPLTYVVIVILPSAATTNRQGYTFYIKLSIPIGTVV